MKKAVSFLVMAAGLVVLTSGCAGTLPRDYYSTVGAGIGGAIGAGAGAAISVVTGGSPVKGAIVGGMAGAAAGGLSGYNRGLAVEQQQAAIAASQAAAVGVNSCTRQERWSGGKLVVDELNCTSSATRAGFRGDPVPPSAAPPAVLYRPASKEIDPYAAR